MTHQTVITDCGNKSNDRIDISFCLPVFNVEKYLPPCLNSILSVKNINYEIICIDDKSTDRSLEVLYEYQKKHSCIKIYENKQNAGVSFTRNELIKNQLESMFGSLPQTI